jgi:quercetin 2,3-dioxygenase
VRHAEANADGERPCRFVQMWLEPARPDGPPRYGGFGPDASGTARLVPPGLPGARLAVTGAPVTVPPAPFGHLHVLAGAVRLGGQELGPGDAALLTGAGGTGAQPLEPGTLFLLWSLPEPWRP